MSYYTQDQGTTDLYSRIMAKFFALKHDLQHNVPAMAFFANPNSSGETKFTKNATNVKIKIMKHNTRISAFVEKRGSTEYVGPERSIRNGYLQSIEDRQFPLIKDEGVITADDTFTIQFFEDVANGTATKTQTDRALGIAMEIYADSISGQVQLHEKLALQSLLEGKMTYNNNGDYFDWGIVGRSARR